MKLKPFLLVMMAVTMPISCSTETEDSVADSAPTPATPTAATLGEQTVLTSSEYLATAAYANADLEKGERQAMICRACHSFEEGGAHMIGPNLHGMFGQPVGTQVGFAYSKAVQDADFTWTPRALDAWLAQPAQFLPGNMMSFAGVRKETDRANLIAYLLEATSRSPN
jgi:cytochrome c